MQSPSVCGNLDNWAARGLAEQDMLFQGPLQMGFFGATRTPFIIGSHTAYRTSAIREIGGFQPTRAEDHLDTVVLAAHGYRGVFVPKIIARGSGPDDFATYLRQQFAWAHSMIGIFLRHTPRLLHRYTFGQAVQFLICQSWYMLWSLSFAVLWLIPTVALFSTADRRGIAPALPPLFPPCPADGDDDVALVAALVPALGRAALVARRAARDRALAGRALGAGQRRPPRQAAVHDHAEGCRAERDRGCSASTDPTSS